MGRFIRSTLRLSLILAVRIALLLEAGFEAFHDINNFRSRRFLWLCNDVLPIDFLIDDPLYVVAHLVDLVFLMELVLCHFLAQLRCKSELVVVDLCLRYFNVLKRHILAFRELIAFDPIRLGASNGAEELDGMDTIPKSMITVPTARAAMGCSERSAEKVLECWTKDSLNRIDKARA